jgi:predicted exporter
MRFRTLLALSTLATFLLMVVAPFTGLRDLAGVFLIAGLAQGILWWVFYRDTDTKGHRS